MEDYYRIRYWKWDSDKLEYVLDSISFQTYEKAKKTYDSFKINKDTPQAELLKEEHNAEGELIYEDQLAIKS